MESDDDKKIWEKLTGKPYEEILLRDMDKVFPGINNDLYKMSAEMIVEFLK